MNVSNNFRKGIHDGLPICFGYFAVSFAFGIFSVKLGLSVAETTLISLFNLTSAGQLAAVPIIAAGGSFIELALSQLVINARYSLMSVSLSQKLDSSIRIRDRFIIAFANTDEIFAVSSAQQGLVGRKYMLGLALAPILGWTFGTLFGAIAGNVLPQILVSALGIAIYAMFIAIVVPVAKINKGVLTASVAAVALSVLLYYAPVLSDIPSGFSIIIIAVIVSSVMALTKPLGEEESDNA